MRCPIAALRLVGELKGPVMSFPLWSVAPFILLLAAIAVLPLLRTTGPWWDRLSSKLAIVAAIGIPTGAAAWYWGGPETVGHTALEYLQFIALLASLFTVTGGMFLAGDLRATPRNNTILLATGAILASLIGTTGAAMLLVRPLLSTNRERERKVHTLVFAVFIIANCGGLLTPVGDPPLYVGLMRGVPFLWTLNLFPAWLFVNGLLLLTFYALDRREWSRESEFAVAWDAAASVRLSLRGASNLVWLGIIVASVALLGDLPWLKMAIQAGAALASYVLTNKQIRFADNQFSWPPILEVVILFAGIFLTMIPALEVLREHAHELPMNVYTFFGFTGSLSAVLDNTPTYLVFFDMATQFSAPGTVLVAGVPELFLTAISLGAVTCGAITYIGNGPNFMVKAVAEERGVAMPSFGGYFVWALRYLVPILVALVLVFLSDSTPLRVAGIVLGLAIVARAFWLIARSRATPQPPAQPAEEPTESPAHQLGLDL